MNSVFEQKIELLKTIFPSYKIRKGNEFVTFCPSKKCKQHNQYKTEIKKKLEINLDNNKFSCWVCQYKGHALKLFTEYGSFNNRKLYANLCGIKSSTINESEQTSRLALPEEYEFIFDSNSNDSAQAIEWAGRNDISYESLLSARVGVCSRGKYKNRIIFPSFNEDFQLNYFITRHLYQNDSFKWLKCEASLKKIIFNECFINWKKPVILVESIKTYLKNFNKLENIIVCNGSLLSREYLLFNKIIIENVPKVFIIFDSDANEKSLKLANSFNEFGVESYHIGVDRQVDEISFYELSQKIKEANQYDRMDSLKDKISNLI